MLKIRQNIRSLYEINLVEGEGVGTSYEYYAKFRKLSNFINSMEHPRNILIAGLPEKYGLSMDFFLLGQLLRAKILVIDDRPDKLEKVRNTLSTLNSRRILNCRHVIFKLANRMEEFYEESQEEGIFDLALSSEVYQRLDGAYERYIDNLKKAAQNFAIFIPNGQNNSHNKLSGLNSVYMEELLKTCRAEQSSTLKIYDYGYVDMPPFPPGLTRSQEKRKSVTGSRFEAILMNGLELYCLLEDIFPKFVKEKIAHIVYVMVKRR